MKRFLLCALLLGVTLPSFAEVPKLMSYSGKLTDRQGKMVADKNYDMRFSLWTAASGGVEVWSEEHYIAQGRGVAVTSGGFNVVLGSYTPLTPMSKPYYIEVRAIIQGSSQTFGRQPMLSVPYAISADSVSDNAITSNKIVDGSITSIDVANGVINNQAKAPWAPLVYSDGTQRNSPKIAYGQSGTNASGFATISLASYGFTQPPTVICTPVNSVYLVSMVLASNPTVSGFSVYSRYSSNDAYGTAFYWIAIGY